jgi:hypothetical protein
MTPRPIVAPRFAPRIEPLTACAAYAFGSRANALVTRLLAFTDAELRLLSGVSSPRLVLVLGDESALPWVFGTRYLGKEPDAPSVLFDTTLAPDLPAHLLARAVREGHAEHGRSSSWALLAEPTLLVNLDSALTLSRTRLQAWQEAFRASPGEAP